MYNVSEVKTVTDEKFCKLYTSYYGEEINTVKQLVQINFTGEELKEFCDYIAESLSLPPVSGSQPTDISQGDV